MGEVAFNRHSIKPDAAKGDPADKEFSSLSVKGVELARERARTDVKALVEQSAPGSVIFYGAASNYARTKETAEIFGEELKKIFEGKNDILVLTKKDIDALNAKKKIDAIKKIIEDNRGKKIVIDYPLYLSELSLKDTGWYLDDNEKQRSPYTEALLAKYGGKLSDAVLRDWIVNEGVIRAKGADGKFQTITGANPTKIAKDSLHAVARLEAFAKRFTGNRPLVLGLSGHSFYLDAMLAYLAGKGEVSGKTFDMVSGGGKMIDPTEMTRINLTPSGGSVTYRGKPYQIDFRIAKDAQSPHKPPAERQKKPFGERRPSRERSERPSREKKVS